MSTDPSVPRKEREQQAAAVERLQRNAETRRDVQADAAAGRFAEPRSWWARTSDEVASWFGATGAMRRRQWDEAAGDHTGKGPQRVVDEDARIEEEIVRRLTADSQVDASRIQVSVGDRIVVLSGAVKTVAEARRVDQLALAAPHVASVRNTLVVE